MIIRFPTAQYTSIIPTNPSDSGNVTFTISNEDPPRSSLLFTELPPAIELRERLPRTLTSKERREAIADRVFTELSASQASTGSNKQIVEVGQVLEFIDSPLSPLDPMLVTSNNEFQHDTNILDLPGLGISEQDLETINQSANALMLEFDQQLNDLIQERRDTEVAISENKKTQNENSKAIDSIQILIDSGQETLQPVVDDLTAQGEQLKQDELELIAKANQIAADANELRDRIRELAEVVR